ncbi:phytanoyl-CoA dioxygenase family protein [Mycolicibacterium moriokaense]|uniref:Phytanoyl-CoA dioxygenase PhyH n=1 Tax=Mycolicibacterium moriokaense TaxID=39691 RepID=A0A318H512_9MYCO|nr:phytanoyl-CoA dioxygenase family protein [Mycolicibacterium moriokaense]PXW99126.1 phytanoyl-CoA dioxygenase PhyH [Mycolicibacterium moriokaense]
MTRTLTELLSNDGIADLTGMWPTKAIEDWNRRLDPLLAKDDPRSYVAADRLVATGIFGEVFTDRVRRLIAGVQPSALLYHFHCYEIASGQTKSHIHADKLGGWHQDDETLKYFTLKFPSYLSIFILLTAVGQDGGPFEFQPGPPGRTVRPGGEVVQLVGPVGTAAIWNRSYFHRAAPNRSPVRRRILKLSFQPAGLPNDRICLDEFRSAFTQLDDPWLQAIVDERRVGTTAPLPGGGDDVQGQTIAPTVVNDVGSAAVMVSRARGAARRLVSAV